MGKSHVHLPEDTFAGILLRLPLKSLGRFRSVRKSWNQIISSENFINAHKNTISNTFLLCHHGYLYSLLDNEELTHYRPYYYKPKLFGINHKNDLGIKVYGSPLIKVYGICHGLLCASEIFLNVNSIIYLLNPVIRKAKRIPDISIDIREDRVHGDLCIGYFDHDYKVIKIIASFSTFYVGVYSLRTDCWKIINSNRDDATFGRYYSNKFNKFVNGVAYFLSFNGRIICFDLYDERITDILLPLSIDNIYHSFQLEVYRESIALVDVYNGVLTMWVLEYCGITKTSTWEEKVTICLGRVAPNIDPLGFLNNGTYLLRDTDQSSNLYLCNLENSDCRGFRDEGVPGRLSHINSLDGNLVLLNEKTLYPFVETESCSTYTQLLFNVTCEKYTAQEKRNKKRFYKRQDKLQTKRKIEETEMKKK